MLDCTPQGSPQERARDGVWHCAQKDTGREVVGSVRTEGKKRSKNFIKFWSL